MLRKSCRAHMTVGLFAFVFAMSMTERHVAGEQDRNSDYKSHTASGTVKEVKRFGKQVGIRISIGANQGVAPMGSVRVYGADRRAIGGEVIEVHASHSLCRINPMRGIPHVGDRVSVSLDSQSVVLVVAEHQTFLDGEPQTWNQAIERLDALACRIRIRVFFRTTGPGQARESDEWKKLRTWCRKSGVRVLTGALTGKAGDYFDGIKVPDDRRKGREVNGVVTLGDKLVTGAEVVLFEDDMARHIYIQNGHLRAPGTFRHRTVTRKGRFILYPETENYHVLVLHPSGMNLMTSEDLNRKVRMPLQPWASVRGHFKDPNPFDLGAVIYSTPSVSRVSVRILLMEVPQRMDGGFIAQHVPPGQVLVRRGIGIPGKTGKSFSCDTFELKAGGLRDAQVRPTEEQQAAIDAHLAQLRQQTEKTK